MYQHCCDLVVVQISMNKEIFDEDKGRMPKIKYQFTTGRRGMMVLSIRCIGVIGRFIWHRNCKRGSAEVGRFGLVEDCASEAGLKGGRTRPEKRKKGRNLIN